MDPTSSTSAAAVTHPPQTLTIRESTPIATAVTAAITSAPPPDANEEKSRDDVKKSEYKTLQESTSQLLALYRNLERQNRPLTEADKAQLGQQRKEWRQLLKDYGSRWGEAASPEPEKPKPNPLSEAEMMKRMVERRRRRIVRMAVGDYGMDG